MCLTLPSVGACPNGLAPTTSTTMQLVLGDALAIALLEGSGFTALDFGPSSGRQARGEARPVREVMHTRRAHPADRSRRPDGGGDCRDDVKGLRLCCGVRTGDRLVGIITDGDLRRRLKPDFSLDTEVASVMTRKPRTIAPDALVAEALEAISHKISALLVVERDQVVGIVHFHDLMRIGAF